MTKPFNQPEDKNNRQQKKRPNHSRIPNHHVDEDPSRHLLDQASTEFSVGASGDHNRTLESVPRNCLYLLGLPDPLAGRETVDMASLGVHTLQQNERLAPQIINQTPGSLSSSVIAPRAEPSVASSSSATWASLANQEPRSPYPFIFGVRRQHNENFLTEDEANESVPIGQRAPPSSPSISISCLLQAAEPGPSPQRTSSQPFSHYHPFGAVPSVPTLPTPEMNPVQEHSRQRPGFHRQRPVVRRSRSRSPLQRRPISPIRINNTTSFYPSPPDNPQKKI